MEKNVRLGCAASVLLVWFVLSLCSRYCSSKASSDVLLLNCLVLVREERIISLAHYLGDWLLSLSAQAVITEYHSLGALKNISNSIRGWEIQDLSVSRFDIW